MAKAIRKGIAYLENHQYPNGAFCSYMAPDIAMQQWCVPDNTVFVTGLIGNALSPLAYDLRVKAMIQQSGYFLKSQMLRCGTWTYFTQWHQWFHSLPADVDDTAIISRLLLNLQISFPDNTSSLLVNRNPDGLFYTWMSVRPLKRQSFHHLLLSMRTLKRPFGFLERQRYGFNRNTIDPSVNANVLYYLGLTETTRPIIAYLTEIIMNRREDQRRWWYHNPLCTYYFISRNYPSMPEALETIRQPLIDRIMDQYRLHGHFGESSLETALAITSLIHLGYTGGEVASGVDYLIHSQHTTGEWSRRGFYHSGPDKRFCFGSEELTSAFCVEALAAYYCAVYSDHSSMLQ
jgi:hypothetical protein